MLPAGVPSYYMRVIVFPSPDALAAGATAAIATAIKGSDRPRVTMGLAGGSTPRSTYEQLRWAAVPWETVDLWLSDERWVPHDHEDSNGRMVSEALVDHIDARFFRPRWSEYLTAADSAAYYEADLRRIVPDGAADVVLLGLGADGHTASLFPETEALGEKTRWFIHNEVPQLNTWRLTATATMIQRAALALMLTAGESKADAVAVALEGPDGSIPAQLLRHAHGEVVWMIDEAAASKLSTTHLERV